MIYNKIKILFFLLKSIEINKIVVYLHCQTTNTITKNKTTMKKNEFIKMSELRNKSDEELMNLAICRKYATKKELTGMERADILSRIMRAQLNAGLQYK